MLFKPLIIIAQKPIYLYRPPMSIYKKDGERTPAYRGGSFLLQREQRH